MDSSQPSESNRRDTHQIAVIGAAEASPEEEQIAYQVGELLAAEACILLTGGRGGVMEASSKGAHDAGGTVVGIVPGSEGNPYLDVIIKTRMGHSRNVILVESATGVIAVGGSYGTLSEIGIALKIKKPVFGIRTWDIPGVIPCSDSTEAVQLLIKYCNSI